MHMRNSFRQALAAASREFKEQRRTQLLRCGAILGILTVAFFTIGWVIFASSHIDEPSLQVAQNYVVGWSLSCIVACYIFSILLSCVSASMMFNKLRSKKSSIVYLMQPESQWVKYASQWLTFVGGFWIVFIAAAIIAYLSCCLLLSSLYPAFFAGGIPTLPNLYRGLSDDFELLINHGLLSLVILCPLATSSFYVVGAAFFRRHAFLLTLVALWVIQMILSIISIIGAKIIYTLSEAFVWDVNTHYDTSPAVTSTLFSILTAIGTIQILFNWWVAYQRFRETDLI